MSPCRPLRAAALAAALMCLSDLAAARSTNDLYINLNLGLSHAPVDCPAGLHCQRNKLGGKLSLGGFVSDQLALEGRWTQLGNTRLGAAADGSSPRLDSTRSGLGLGGAYWQEFGPRTYGVLRGGVSSERVNLTLEAADGSRRSQAARRWGPYAGLGLLQALAPQAHLVADLDLIRSHDGAGQQRNVVALSLGLGLRF